ncbi:MAG: 50S ribosomal protein L29 [Chitinivibrionales bacterium]
MKMHEIKQLALRELQEKSAVLEEELFNLRFQAKTGQLSNPVRLRIVRRDIARVKTLMGDKARAAAPAAAASSSTPSQASSSTPSLTGKTK